MLFQNIINFLLYKIEEYSIQLKKKKNTTSEPEYFKIKAYKNIIKIIKNIYKDNDNVTKKKINLLNITSDMKKKLLNIYNNNIQYNYSKFNKKNVITYNKLLNFDNNLKKHIRINKLKISYYILGSYYRKLKYINDIDILIYGDLNKFINFVNKYTKYKIIVDNNKLSSYKYNKIIKGQIFIKDISYNVELYHTNKKNIISMKLYLSVGTKENIRLRKIAKSKGFKLNRYGLYNSKNIKVKNLNSIDDYYNYILSL
tara:strand:+ start:371 stop:1138 length:768 start_codon:yes stop_codon:yes gene_type:complete